MIYLLGKVCFYFLLALAFALFEVENEGKYGWSERSQTWYRSATHYPKWLGIILGRKPLTGYHIFIFLAAFLVAHVHFFMGVPWSLQSELLALAIYFAWAPLWDFLWLIFNPYYGLNKLGSKQIWWYKNSWWLGGKVPWENVGQWLVSLVIAYLGGGLMVQIEFLGGLTLLTLVSVISLVPAYKFWNMQMHKYDDRRMRR